MNISIFSARLHSIKVVLFERNTLTHEFPTARKFFLCLSGSQTLYFLFRDCRAREWNKPRGFIDRWLAWSSILAENNVCVQAILDWVNVTIETR